MPRIMFMGDTMGKVTGLSYVSSSFARYFTAKYGSENIAYVTVCGPDTTIENLNAHGDDVREDLKGITLYNYQVHDKGKAHDFNKAMVEFQPDIVISILDPWNLDQISLSAYRDSCFWAAYCTIETPEYPKTLLHSTAIYTAARKSIYDTMKGCDLIVPCTKMGKSFFENTFGLATSENVYNGVDLDLRAEEPIDRESFFHGRVTANDFLFVSMGLNSNRKRIDRVIDAFAAFVNQRQDRAKYKLYIHTDPDHILDGTDIEEQIAHLGMHGAIFTMPQTKEHALPKETLYQIYKSADCYIGLPGGEGFGYGFAEAMMHGLPVIYIDHGGHVEYCRECGIAVDVSDTLPIQGAYIRWALADIPSAVKAMNRMVSDPKLRESLSKRAFEKSKEFAWPVVCEKLDRTIMEAYAKSPKSQRTKIQKRRVV
jgi:glycosyltransferase involved in cell wall biosynthesis